MLNEWANRCRKTVFGDKKKKDLELPVLGVMMLITAGKPLHILPQIDPNIKEKMLSWPSRTVVSTKCNSL